jgi:predicted nucleic acid-binding Zn ribbon protein
VERGEGPSLIRNVLEQYFEKHRRIQYEVKTREALKVWSLIVDDYIRDHTEPVYIKKHTLYVKTDSSALAGELSMREGDLLRKLNESLNTHLLKRIVFKSGSITAHGKKSRKQEQGSAQLTSKTLKKIDNIVRRIKEDELRGILKKFLKSTAKKRDFEK